MALAQDGHRTYLELRQSAFKQNTFAAWRPANTPFQNFILLLVFGLIFLGIGLLYLISSSTITTIVTPYGGKTRMISVGVSIKDQMHPPIFVYYEITNIHQNYRRFAYSRSKDQLNGKYVNKASEVKQCYPVVTESERLGKLRNDSHDREQYNQ
jgi:hypothetical protein